MRIAFDGALKQPDDLLGRGRGSRLHEQTIALGVSDERVVTGRRCAHDVSAIGRRQGADHAGADQAARERVHQPPFGGQRVAADAGAPFRFGDARPLQRCVKRQVVGAPPQRGLQRPTDAEHFQSRVTIPRRGQLRHGRQRNHVQPRDAAQVREHGGGDAGTDGLRGWLRVEGQHRKDRRGPLGPRPSPRESPAAATVRIRARRRS